MWPPIHEFQYACELNNRHAGAIFEYCDEKTDKALFATIVVDTNQPLDIGPETALAASLDVSGVPSASDVDTPHKASDAAQVQPPFGGNLTKVDDMCKNMCDHGMTGRKTVYSSYTHAIGGTTITTTNTTIYCEDCVAHNETTSSDSSSSSTDSELAVFVHKLLLSFRPQSHGKRSIRLW